ALEQEDDTRRGGHPADAGRCTGKGCEADVGVLADEHRKVRGDDQREHEAPAEDLGRISPLEIGRCEAVVLHPGLAEEDRRVPDTADEKRRERGEEDREPVELRWVHAPTLAARYGGQRRRRTEAGARGPERGPGAPEPGAARSTARAASAKISR